MIKAENVVKVFHGYGTTVRAVDGVSTEVERGEVVVVIGPSGSGKSTFLRCINGLEVFSEGHIIIDGVDLADKKTNIHKVRMEVGMVFQSFNLFPHMSAKQNVSIAQIRVRGRKRREADERSVELLRKVGLEDKVDEFPDRLSGRSRPAVADRRRAGLGTLRPCPRGRPCGAARPSARLPRPACGRGP